MQRSCLGTDAGLEGAATHRGPLEVAASEPGGRITRHQIALVGGFYMWTAPTSVGFDFSPRSDEDYNLLTSAFLRDHT